MRRFFFFLLLSISVAVYAEGPSTVVLKRSWVEKYKDRATIDGVMRIDHALKKPNPGSKDGDIHAAGRSPQVGLPMVAEVMNAALEPGTLDLIHAREKDKKLVSISGVWRLWFEHPPSGDTQIQDFTDMSEAEDTNPPHCFEIHPLTNVGGTDVANDTFKSIPGFTPKDAAQAFGRYEKLRITIRAGSDSIALASSMIGFNYVQFRMRLLDKAVDLPDPSDGSKADGMQALVDIFPVEAGDDEEPLASGVRVILVKDTGPAEKIKTLGADDEIVVLGIPRVNLNAVMTFVDQGGNEAIDRKLPYEMVIVDAEGAGSSETGSAGDNGAQASSRRKTPAASTSSAKSPKGSTSKKPGKRRTDKTA